MVMATAMILQRFQVSMVDPSYDLREWTDCSVSLLC